MNAIKRNASACRGIARARLEMSTKQRHAESEENKMISHNRVTYLIVVETNYADWPEDQGVEIYRGGFEMPCGHALCDDELKKRVCEDITYDICGFGA